MPKKAATPQMRVQRKFPGAVAIVVSSGVHIIAIIGRADSKSGDGTAEKRAWLDAARRINV